MTDAGSAERPATAGDVVRSVILTTADRLVATQSAAIAERPATRSCPPPISREYPCTRVTGAATARWRRSVR